MAYAAGSLVKARGREWVVQPESADDLLVLRPLGGTDLEIAGIYLPLEGEDVRPAAFDLPDPARPGDFRSCRLLRDAVRLGFRSSAGPFRSFGRLNVEPRPYQLVPLLMALRLDPVRLLIADDVGIGKTIEAALIARELLDRGEVRRLTVLCPPHLAEQWREELAGKFHIQAELVLPGTVARLERDTAPGQSLFEIHPFTVVSTDYIKSSRRRDDFVRACAELVIVDEAHTCAYSAEQRGGRHLRHQLLRALAAVPGRHLILVTATPHSGDEGAFRSLLSLLRPEFEDLPENLAGAAHEVERRKVAMHMVQRRRAEVQGFMADTVFPQREEAEVGYALTDEYLKLLRAVLDYARERVHDQSGTQFHQRVRWWSVLALLRSLASSPAAAAATLRNRSIAAEASDETEADLLGERAVLDLDDVEGEAFDMAPGALDDGDPSEQAAQSAATGERSTRRDHLLRLARRAEALRGPAADTKLKMAIELVGQLLKDGYKPIVFCRFIPTAEYVAEAMRAALPGDVEVAAVTGTLAPAEREARVAALGEHPRHVLVATDCLSEGINLQEHFDAVVHYDLSWNPTRHEQREGRVDRYGQPKVTVRTVTYYGLDNQIDGLVLDVLLRKHKKIRNSLGIAVPVPVDAGQVAQALVNGLLLRGAPGPAPGQLSLFDWTQEIAQGLHAEWDAVAEREQRSRFLFAQHGIDAAQVAAEWQATRSVAGTGTDVQRFVEEVVTAHGGAVSRRGRAVELHFPAIAALREAAGNAGTLRACFELPAPEGAQYLTRTHPVVERLAAYVLDAALDPLLPAGSVARRCGAIRTSSVSTRTTLLIVRLRYHIIETRRDGAAVEMLAEDAQLLGFTGAPASAQWLPRETVEALLDAQLVADISPPQAGDFVRRAVEGYDSLRPELEAAALRRGEELLEAHRRVRAAAKIKGVKQEIKPHLPVDVLGIYVLLPALV